MAPAAAVISTEFSGLYLYNDSLWINDASGWRQLTYSRTISGGLEETPVGGTSRSASDDSRILLFRYYCTHPERTLNGGVPERAKFLFAELEAAEKRWPGSALVEYCKRSVQNYFGVRQTALAQLVPAQAKLWRARWVAPANVPAAPRPLAPARRSLVASPPQTGPKITPPPVAQSLSAGILVANRKDSDPAPVDRAPAAAQPVAPKPTVAAKPAGCQPEGSYEIVKDSDSKLALQRANQPRLLAWAHYYDEKMNWVGCFVPLALKGYKPEPEYPKDNVTAGEEYSLDSSVKSQLWDFYCSQPEIILSSTDAAEFITNNWADTTDFRKCLERLPGRLREMIENKRIAPALASQIESRLRRANTDRNRWMGLAMGAAKFPPPPRKKDEAITAVKGDFPLAISPHDGLLIQDAQGKLAEISYDYHPDHLAAEDGTVLNSPEARQAIARALCEPPRTAFTNPNQLEFLVRYLSKNPSEEADRCAERLGNYYLTLKPYSEDRDLLRPHQAAAELGWARGSAGEIIGRILAEEGRKFIKVKNDRGKEAYADVQTTEKEDIMLGSGAGLIFVDKEGVGHPFYTSDVLAPKEGSPWSEVGKAERQRAVADVLEVVRNLPGTRPSYIESLANELARKLAHESMAENKPVEAAQWVARLYRALPNSRAAAQLSDGLRDKFTQPDDWEKILNEELMGATPAADEFSSYACQSVCNLFASYAEEWGKENPQTRWVSRDASAKAPMEFAILSLQALFLVRAAPYCQDRPGVDAAKTMATVEGFWKKARQMPGSLSGHLGAYASHFSILMAQETGDRAMEKEMREKLSELLSSTNISVSTANGSALQTYGLSSTTLSLDLKDIPDSQTLGADRANPVSRLEWALDKFMKWRNPDFGFEKVKQHPEMMETALGTPYNLIFNGDYRYHKGDSAARNVTLYMALYRSHPEKYKDMIVPVLENFARYRGSLVLDYGVTDPGEKEHGGRYGHASYYWGPALPYAIDWLHDVLKNESWTAKERESLLAVEAQLKGALKTATSRASLFSKEGRDRLGAHGSWEIPLAGTSLIAFIDRCNGAKGDGSAILKNWKTKRKSDSYAHAGPKETEPLHIRAGVQ